MNQRLKWVLGLGALGAGALGLAVFATKKAMTKTSGFLQVPLKSGSLPDQTLAAGGVLDVIAPPGATLMGGNASPTVLAPSTPPDAQTYRWAAYTTGRAQINVAWADSSGARQDTSFQVVVS